MDWKTYEQVVKQIYETLGSEFGVKIECYGKSCTVIGKSNVPHQIDVLTSQTNGAHNIKTAIECKYWNKKVTKDAIMKLAGIIEDSNINQGIVVSKLGFTPHAIKIAETKNIKLVQLHGYNSTQKGNLLTKHYMHLEVDNAALSAVTVILPPGDRMQDKFMESYLYKNPSYDYNFHYKDGSVKKVKELIVEFLNNKVRQNTTLNLITDKIMFPAGTFIKSPKSEETFFLNGIILSGYPINYTLLGDDYFENKIWLIMKLIFEKKTLYYTTEGKVSETKPRYNIEANFPGQAVHVHLKLRSKQFIITEL